MRRGFAVAGLAIGLAGNTLAQLPAFPGAEGYGAYATGGRSGDVYHVTTLNSSGPGSFADAIATVPATGRTIVFDVSGYIRFPSGSSGTRLTSSKVTIAGQTAPGDGIGFYNNFFRISGDDVVIRYVRFRMGKYGSGGDCVDLDSGCLNAILDHISMEFSTDENISSFSSPPENLTLQYSLNSWGLESHSCGGLWDQNHATSHHNLWSHNHTRNPKSRPNGLLEWINNVTFDWDIGFIMGDSQSAYNWKANVISNYFICPPGNTHSKALVKGTVASNGKPNFTVYLGGNLADNNGDGLLNGTDQGYSIVEGTVYSGAQTGTPGDLGYYQSASPIAGSTAGVAMDPPLLAYKKIVSNAGALRLDSAYTGTIRDEVDTILINKLTTLTPFHVTRESDTGASNSGFGTLNSVPPPIDTDRDGMPDYWETAVGRNPAVDDHIVNVAASPSSYMPTNGYTSLEEYLYFLAEPHGVVAKFTISDPSFIDVDLRKFTAGFTNAPVFTLTNAVNGVATLSNGFIAHFVPNTNFSGRASFGFKVTDADASTWTQTMCVLVSASGVPRNLVWKGDGTGNIWDTSVVNWLNNTNVTTFGTGDSATFDDTGTNSPSITLTNAVLPGGVTINATKSYTITGTGSLSGGMALLKSGTGTLTLTTANDFSGGTILDSSTVQLNTGGLLGTGALIFNNGTLRSAYAAGNTLSFDPALNVPAGNSGTLLMSTRTEMNGALAGAGTFTVDAPSTLAGTRDYWDSAAAAFTGTIQIRGGGVIDLRIVGGSFDGFDNATVIVSNETVRTFNNSGGNTLKVGALSGHSSAVLQGAVSAAGTNTWEIGGHNTDTTFAGSIQDGGGGVSALKKSGSGVLTLSGNNTFTGATTVSNGTLLVSGSLGSTVVTVLNGATFGGNGTMAGTLTNRAGSTVSPGMSAGTLTVSNKFAASGANLIYELSSSPTGNNDKVTVPTGGLVYLSGVNTFYIQFTDGVFSNGSYYLIDGNATLGVAGGMSMVLSNIPSGTRQGFALVRPASGSTPAYVRLDVTGNAGSLVWTGHVSNVWDYNATTNWLNTGAGDTFYNFDAATFNDSAATKSIIVTGTVQPRVMTVSNSVAYSITSTNGSIGGAGSLTKLGPGTLTLQGSNTYSGGTFILGGTIALTDVSTNVSNPNALGSGAVTLDGGSLAMYSHPTLTVNSGTMPNDFIVNTTGTLTAAARCGLSGHLTGGGTLNYRVPYVRADMSGDWSGFTGHINVLNTDGDGGDFRVATSYSNPGFASAAIYLSTNMALYFTGTAATGAGTTVDIGELSGLSSSHLLGAPTGGRTLTWRIGARNSDAIFAGTITEQGASSLTAIEKIGTGTWTLTNTNNTYIGGTTISAGKLLVNNAGSSGLGYGPVSVASGATLGGSGRIDAQVTMDGGATLTPAGTFTVDDDLSLAGGTTLQFDLGTSNDLVAVSGDLTLGGVLNISPTSGFAGGTYTLFTYGGSLDGTLPTLGTVPDGYEYTFDTSMSGQVKLVVTPTAFPQWQLTFFGCTNCAPAAGNADTDGDGMSNTNEFLAGTNPTNSASALRIISVVPAGNDTRIFWQTAGGRTNAVQSTTDLGTNFTDLSGLLVITGSGEATTNWLHVGGATNAPSQYYRIRVVP